MEKPPSDYDDDEPSESDDGAYTVRKPLKARQKGG
jgi:hypothetical protein